MSKKEKNQNFLVTVRSRENATWQGTVKWIESGKQENFRSALELLKLMDSVLEESEEAPAAE